MLSAGALRSAPRRHGASAGVGARFLHGEATEATDR